MTMVAGNVICEVWHCAPYSIVECVGILAFGHVRLHPFHCVLRFTVCSCGEFWLDLVS